MACWGQPARHCAFWLAARSTQRPLHVNRSAIHPKTNTHQSANGQHCGMRFTYTIGRTRGGLWRLRIYERSCGGLRCFEDGTGNWAWVLRRIGPFRHVPLGRRFVDERGWE